MNLVLVVVLLLAFFFGAIWMVDNLADAEMARAMGQLGEAQKLDAMSRFTEQLTGLLMVILLLALVAAVFGLLYYRSKALVKPSKEVHIYPRQPQMAQPADPLAQLQPGGDPMDMLVKLELLKAIQAMKKNQPQDW